MRILEAILAGERDPAVLATLCSTRIKASRETVAKSLHGNWREELLFSLAWPWTPTALLKAKSPSAMHALLSTSRNLKIEPSSKRRLPD